MTTPAAGEIMSAKPLDQAQMLTAKLWRNCGFLPVFMLRRSMSRKNINKINE